MAADWDINVWLVLPNHEKVSYSARLLKVGRGDLSSAFDQIVKDFIAEHGGDVLSVGFTATSKQKTNKKRRH